MRNAPDKAMTRAPCSSNFGAISADAPSGSARNTMSAEATRWPISSGVTGWSQIRASAGSGRGVLVAPDDIAAVNATLGCRASSRTSSCPA